MSCRIPAEDIPEGGVRVVEIDGDEVAIFRSGGRCHALGNRCPHSGGPLALGRVENGEVVCPWHGARFALEDGRPTWGPVDHGVAAYAVHEGGSELRIEPREAQTSK